MEPVAGKPVGLSLAPPETGARAEHLLRSLLGDPPDHLRPTDKEHTLIVALVWGSDHLLDLREVEPGGRLKIGADSSADLQVFHDVTRLGHIPVVEAPLSGPARLFLPAGSSARVHTSDRELTTIELMEEGLATRCHVPFEGAWFELGLHDRAAMQFGQVRLIARYLRPANPHRKSPYGAAFWTRVAIYLLSAFAVYRLAAATDFGPLFVKPGVIVPGEDPTTAAP